VFVSRVSQTIDYKRGVNGNILSSRLLNDVFISRVSKTRDYKRDGKGTMLCTSFNRREERMLPFTPRLYSLIWLTRYTNTSFNRREESMLPFTPRLYYKRGVNGSMLSSRLLNDVFVSRVSQTRDYKRVAKGNLTDGRRGCYHLHHVYILLFDSHGTRTHHLTDARRACYPLHHVYILWFDSHGNVFVYRVSQIREYKRGVNGSILSSRLLNDVLVSHVNQTINYKRV
jgi:hypothetical protein